MDGTHRDRLVDARASATTLLVDIQSDFPDYPYAALPDDHARRLRAWIRDYTEALRDTGATPEHVVKELKSVVAETLQAPDGYAGRLMEAVITWTIEEYFRERA